MGMRQCEGNDATAADGGKPADGPSRVDAAADGGSDDACTAYGCGDRCDADEYCWFPDWGAVGQHSGSCMPRPEQCSDISAPVCGCDGASYGNPCKAALAGVAIARYGECPEPSSCLYDGEPHAVGSSYPAADGCNTCSCQGDGTSACTEKACPEPRSCGGHAAESCHDDEYCKFTTEAMCGRAAVGVCMPKPECSASGPVVCGCDGESYDSECEAAAMGTGVLHRGFCNGCAYAGMTWVDGAELTSLDGCNTCTCDGATGEVHCGDSVCPEVTCGGSTFMACPAFQFCDYTSSNSCGDLSTGTCKRTPDAATCPAVDEPVCGCDGMTYSNECKANAQQVSVRSRGPCEIADGCDYHGHHSIVGGAFPADDHCNRCTCQKDGTVNCTAVGCE
jgi:hypothetical protein